VSARTTNDGRILDNCMRLTLDERHTSKQIIFATIVKDIKEMSAATIPAEAATSGATLCLASLTFASQLIPT
jgi:hypothetical protein